MKPTGNRKNHLNQPRKHPNNSGKNRLQLTAAHERREKLEEERLLDEEDSEGDETPHR